MRLITIIFLLLATPAFSMGAWTTDKAPPEITKDKGCKGYTDAAHCAADIKCGWDAHGGPDNAGKCKDADKIKPQVDK